MSEAREYDDLFARLAAPFEQHEIKTRSQGGRQLAYITARTAMNRLDDVLGPARWWDHYIPGENSVLCQLTIRLPDGSTLTKEDAGGYAGMADSGDDDKSGFSDAFKRACVKLGVGRYLYRDGVPRFATEHHGEVPNDPPAQSSRPERPGRQEWSGAQNAAGRGSEPPQHRGQVPRSGKALFAWTKDMEQKHSVGLLKYLNGWAKLQDFPARMVDWDAEQVNLAYAEASRKLQGVGNDTEAYEQALAN